MSSVALWYQTEPHKKWADLTAGQQRLPFTEHLLLKGHEVVTKATHSGQYPVEVQSLGGVTDGKQLWFKPTEAESWVQVTFQTDKEQTTQLSAKMVHSWDYGIYQVKLDGKDLERLNLYAADVTPTVHKLGTQKLSVGQHVLRFECVGKSPNSAGYFLGFDALAARVPVYSRAAEVDLRTIQKVK